MYLLDHQMTTTTTTTTTTNYSLHSNNYQMTNVMSYGIFIEKRKKKTFHSLKFIFYWIHQTVTKWSSLFFIDYIYSNDDDLIIYSLVCVRVYICVCVGVLNYMFFFCCCTGHRLSSSIIMQFFYINIIVLRIMKSWLNITGLVWWWWW